MALWSRSSRVFCITMLKKKQSKPATDRLEKILQKFEKEDGILRSEDPRKDLEIALAEYAASVAEHPAFFHYESLSLRAIALQQTAEGLRKLSAKSSELSRIGDLVDAAYIDEPLVDFVGAMRSEKTEAPLEENPLIELYKNYRDTKFSPPSSAAKEETNLYKKAKREWEAAVKKDMQNFPELTEGRIADLETKVAVLENKRNEIFAMIKLIRELSSDLTDPIAQKRIGELYLRLLQKNSGFEKGIENLKNSYKPVQLFSAAKELSSSTPFKKIKLDQLPFRLNARLGDYADRYEQREWRERKKKTGLPPTILELDRNELRMEFKAESFDVLADTEEKGNTLELQSAVSVTEELDEKFKSERWHQILKILWPTLSPAEKSFIKRMQSGELDDVAMLPTDRKCKERIIKKAKAIKKELKKEK